MLKQINYTLYSPTEEKLLKILFILYKVMGLAPVYLKKHPAKLGEENSKKNNSVKYSINNIEHSSLYYVKIFFILLHIYI